MTAYFDTSSLIKLYVDEADSPQVQALVAEADVLVTSVLAYPEARATVARRRHEHLMTAAEARAAVVQLDADWAHLVVLPFDAVLARSAGRHADAYRVRGADAVHLASFEYLLGRCEDDDVRFVCADARLAKAARAMGHAH